MRSATGPRRSVNLTLPAALLEQARQAGLNLSGLAEAAIVAEVARVTRERFAAEISRGVALHHQLLAEHGSFAAQVLALRDGDDSDAGGPAALARHRPPARPRHPAPLALILLQHIVRQTVAAAPPDGSRTCCCRGSCWTRWPKLTTCSTSPPCPVPPSLGPGRGGCRHRRARRRLPRPSGRPAAS